MNWEELPMKSELFELLRKGRHVSSVDGECFKELAENETVFRKFFASLGFLLERHEKDFFYFQGSKSSSFSAKAAVFFFILVEWISDQGGSTIQWLFEQVTHVDNLPHLERERYKKYMIETGIDSKDDLMNLLKKMEKLGFINFENERSFIFRKPAFRFLDLCREIKNEEETNGNQ